MSICLTRGKATSRTDHRPDGLEGLDDSVNNWHDSVNNRHDSVNNRHDSVNNRHDSVNNRHEGSTGQRGRCCHVDTTVGGFVAAAGSLRAMEVWPEGVDS
jgi:hypothetical protein